MTPYEFVSLLLFVIDSLVLLCASYWLIRLVIRWEKEHPSKAEVDGELEKILKMWDGPNLTEIRWTPKTSIVLRPQKKSPSLAKTINKSIKKEMSRRGPDGRPKAPKDSVPMAFFPGQFHMVDKPLRRRKR